MQTLEEQIRRLGAEVLVVTFTEPGKLAAYLQRHPLPFPAVADPARESYRVFALARTSWRAMFHPRVLGRYLRLLVRGWLPRKPVPGDDLLQLGGDFILDGRRRLTYAYRSTEPTDRPRVGELLRALQDTAQQNQAVSA